MRRVLALAPPHRWRLVRQFYDYTHEIIEFSPGMTLAITSPSQVHGIRMIPEPESKKVSKKSLEGVRYEARNDHEVQSAVRRTTGGPQQFSKFDRPTIRSPGERNARRG